MPLLFGLAISDLLLVCYYGQYRPIGIGHRLFEKFMTPCRDIAIPQMPFIPQDAVAALDAGVEVGCPRVHAGATSTTPWLIIEPVAIYLNHLRRFCESRLTR